MTAPTPVDVLLVEDNPRDAELTLRSLRKAHLANPVMHVTDGADAVDFLFGTGAHAGRGGVTVPKVIFLDVKLPKLNGLEVLERIKGDPRTRDIPVVMLTSSAEEPDIQAAYGLGANSYVVKPLDFKDFADAVSKIGLYWLFTNHPPV